MVGFKNDRASPILELQKQYKYSVTRNKVNFYTG